MQIGTNNTKEGQRGTLESSETGMLHESSLSKGWGHQLAHRTFFSNSRASSDVVECFLMALGRSRETSSWLIGNFASVYELQDSRVSSDGTKERKEDIAGDTNMKDATNSFHKLVKGPSLHKKDDTRVGNDTHRNTVVSSVHADVSKEIGQHMEGAINEPAHAADVHLVTPPERCPAFERLEYASGNKGPNFSLPIKHESIGRESGSSGQGRDNEDTIAPRNENDAQVTMHIAVVKAQLQKERASNIPQKNDVNFKGSDNKHAHEVPSSTLPATLEKQITRASRKQHIVQ